MWLIMEMETFKCKSWYDFFPLHLTGTGSLNLGSSFTWDMSILCILWMKVWGKEKPHDWNLSFHWDLWCFPSLPHKSLTTLLIKWKNTYSYHFKKIHTLIKLFCYSDGRIYVFYKKVALLTNDPCKKQLFL